MHVSPHLWGFHSPDILKFLLVRFIPTHVGLTAVPPGAWARPAVHPHARGAYIVQNSDRVLWDGSSPRTWGLLTEPGAMFLREMVHPHARGAYPVCVDEPEIERRFIPTHVGLTVVMGLVLVAHHGSSPRTWGLRQESTVWHQSRRFIPTHVGLMYWSSRPAS